MSSDNDGFKGQQTFHTRDNAFNQQAFAIEQGIHKINVATLVEIVGVAESGRIAPVGYVDVKPLVNQMDGARNAVPQGIIYSVPYMRTQGGRNAVIVDPQMGDVGLCVFADRDISAVKANKGTANPGSDRRFDMADAVYVGGCLNGVPDRYVFVDDSGIEIEGVGKVEIHGDDVVIRGKTLHLAFDTIQMDGAITGTSATTASFAGDVMAGGKSLASHVHGGVQKGGDSTDGPS